MDIGIKKIDLTLRGLAGSPLVIHNFSEKARKEIRDKQQKKAKKAKEERQPAAEFEAAKYVDGQERECVRVEAIKKSLVSAGTAMDNMTKVAIRQALFVQPLADLKSQLAYKSDPCGFYTGNWDSFVTKMKDDPKTIEPDNDFTVKDGELENIAELEAEEERAKQEAEARRQAGLPVWDEPEPEPPPVDTKTLPLPGVE